MLLVYHSSTVAMEKFTYVHRTDVHMVKEHC